jgi:hypothetical protein
MFYILILSKLSWLTDISGQDWQKYISDRRFLVAQDNLSQTDVSIQNRPLGPEPGKTTFRCPM